jgi:curved DNA-binding protein CbpA
MQMQRDQAMQYFRKLALLLHPDKNQHLQAKEAFQKLSEAQ